MERTRRWFDGAAADVGLVVWGVVWGGSACKDWGYGGFVLLRLQWRRCIAGRRDKSADCWELQFETW